MELTRREFSAMAAALGAALAYPSTAEAKVRWSEKRSAFPQGVGSGDPDANSVILWTRREPDAGAKAYRLSVQVALDPEFRKIAARGSTTVDGGTDWTARFLAAGLKPSQEYWYRFTDESGAGSRIGRTLTAPAENDNRPFSFAFVSCQDPTQGALNAYRKMIFEDERRPPEERLGFVLHLGDFFYELVWYPEESKDGKERGRRLRDLVRYPNGEKVQNFHVPATLADYRTAYRAYLTDPDLQDARARWPFVPVWDNHEFSWQGWQSQQVFGGEVRPAQDKKVFANQAWFEFQPARVLQPGGMVLERFKAPEVHEAPIEKWDELGLGLEPNNLAAIRSLIIRRKLRWGANADLIITDNRSFAGPPASAEGLDFKGFPYVFPEEANEILEGGRDYNAGKPPATIRWGDRDVPNPAKDSPRQSYLGVEQKAWLLSELRGSKKPWKIWGHSIGTTKARINIQNLPDDLRKGWPGGYGLNMGGNDLDHGEIADLLKSEGITGLAIVAGDKHSFWAGTFSKYLPPRPFEPLAVEFITGSISAQGMTEVAEINFPKTHPLRALYLYDKPDGRILPSVNMTFLHGVRSSLKLKETGDVQAALALSNPEQSPNLSFVDMGGHGYATVRVSPAEMVTEFVCIPRPFERAETPDGGPLAYRLRHRVPLWRAGKPARMEQQLVEGKLPI
jgi:alkaline phosphatase D